MSAAIRIWTCAAYHPAFRCGGWASVRLVDGQVSGAAGGERYTTIGRMALAGLAWALRDLPASAAPLAVGVRTASPELAAVSRRLAAPDKAAEAPDEDLDLWAQILAAASGRRLSIDISSPKPGDPLAFAAAWAELGRDKAKATGTFTAAIPKANLAKLALG
jgi:hypothetical protein